MTALFASVLGLLFGADLLVSHAATIPKVDFNREVRPILSENCYKCHGPDDEARKAKLRLDIPDAPLKPAKSGAIPIVPGAPEKSELASRISSTDDDERMPPLKSGKKLTAAQIDTIKRWISEGAKYSTHWAYVKPTRPALPSVKQRDWVRNPIDRFILARLEREHLKPSTEAEKYQLIRRVSLDVTGLPPTLAEVDAFLKDQRPDAYERLVDHLLAKPAYGEHWARMWLDLARYADSAGYADDPPRTIWAYRDYVIRAFNSNKAFDRFTLEQLAGDLLPDADEDDQIATAFHRNTMTNNEGGTIDEEFRNAAIIDRVNTTMAVWMGTSMGCAQCHNHKYDPITQQEYFRFFAILNNTADADLKDESPLLNIYTPEQKKQRATWQARLAEIDKEFKREDKGSLERQAQWEASLSSAVQWATLEPANLKASGGGTIEPVGNGIFRVSPLMKQEVYTVTTPAPVKKITGVKLELIPTTAEPERGTYAITHLSARVKPAESNITARYMRVELPGESRILSLAEIEVFSGGTNIALAGEASQSSTDFAGEAKLAIDGKTDGKYDSKSTTHTQVSNNPWWELDLKAAKAIDKLTLWNRLDGELHSRLDGFHISLLDDARKSVWSKQIAKAPKTKASYMPGEPTEIEFTAVYGDENRAALDADPAALLKESKGPKKGWPVDPMDKQTHVLTFVTATPIEIPAKATLEFAVSQKAEHDHCPLAPLKLSITADEHISELGKVPSNLLPVLAAKGTRTPAQRQELSYYYRSKIDPALETVRTEQTKLSKQLSGMEPITVPVMKELAGEKRRKSHIQSRGNYLALGDEVTPGVPAIFPPLVTNRPPDRLALAEWLVDENNPLTARVTANRFWEQIFGIGICRTSEDFGSQGELPTHPELLDWLATELVQTKWDMKRFVRLLVTSAAYRQNSHVTPELAERDPDNLLLARGPRFRMPAEVVRDQALAVSGLLSEKEFGPPVRPPQPSLGLTAAFGGSLDWKTSEGEDRYRRGLYIEWRRTSLYPSISTFDAPSREVCALRRPRSNTPLQALVTLNDPVYIEAAQSLGRRMATLTCSSSAPNAAAEEKIVAGFRMCLGRTPSQYETGRLEKLYQHALEGFLSSPDQAKAMATEPLKSGPTGVKIEELAAYTAVANVMLNLDEFLMKP